MALPVLNNAASIDASTIQQTVLNAAAKTGKLQITNNGSVNFTNYVQGQQTATKESTNFFSDATNRTLGEIKNLLTALNNNIGRFIQTANIEKSVATNLAEAAKPKDIDETGYKLVDLRDDFKTIISSLGEKLSYDKQKQTGGMGGFGNIGGMAGFAGGLLSRMGLVFKSLTKAIPLLAGAYVINMLTGGKLEKTISTLSDKVLKEIGGVFGGTDGGDTGGGTAHNEPGEIGDTGRQTPQTRPSTTQQPSVSQPQKTTLPAQNGSLIKTAISFEGKTEGVNKNEINAFFEKNLGGGYKVSEAWCAMFVNSVLVSNGYKKTSSPKSAKSFLNYGVKVNLNEAVPGDIAVFNRGKNRNKGHVGFFVSLDGNFITILGGNQGDKDGGGVTKSKRNINTKDHELVAIRRPSEIDNNTASKELPLINEQPKTTKNNNSLQITSKSTASKVIGAVGSAIGTILGISDANATQDITRTNPDEGLKMPSGGMQPTATKEKELKNNRTNINAASPARVKQAMNFFMGKGLTIEQSAGIVGNMLQENPAFGLGAGGDNGKAAGLFQWQGKRQIGMGKTFESQLQHAWDEMTGASPTKDAGAQKALRLIRNSKTYAESAEHFVKHFERAGDPRLSNRIKYAKGAMDLMKPSKETVADTKKQTPITQQPNTADTTTPQTQQPNTADTTTPQTQQPETDELLEQIKETFPGAEKLAMFGHEGFLKAALSGSKEDISSGIEDFVSSIKNVGDVLRAKVKSSQEQPMPEKSPWTALLEQADPKNVLKQETASVQPTQEAIKGEQLNEAAKSVESARTKVMYENNKKDISPVMTPNPPQVTQKRSDNPPSRSTMGINNMALRNSEEPVLFRLLVKSLDIGSVA